LGASLDFLLPNPMRIFIGSIKKIKAFEISRIAAIQYFKIIFMNSENEIRKNIMIYQLKRCKNLQFLNEN